MPHLRIEINRSLTGAAKIALAEQMRQLFAEVMGSGTDHVSISIHESGTYDLSIGRVTAPEKPAPAGFVSGAVPNLAGKPASRRSEIY